MSKLGAFIILIILIGVVGYIYYQNSNDVGVKIDKLKLTYAISPNSDPANLILFSEKLSQISTTNKSQKDLVDFESNYWYAVGLNKEITKYMSKDGLFGKNCFADAEFKKIVINSSTAKTYINTALQQFQTAKTSYTSSEIADWEKRLANLANTIQINYDILYTICPTK